MKFEQDSPEPGGCALQAPAAPTVLVGGLSGEAWVEGTTVPTAPGLPCSNFMPAASAWAPTGQIEVLPCGCEHRQEVETGAPDYHERWMPHEQCHAHARRCPDDGRCWHNCGEGSCWRVSACGPLSGVFPRNEWPDEIVAAHGGSDG